MDLFLKLVLILIALLTLTTRHTNDEQEGMASHLRALSLRLTTHVQQSAAGLFSAPSSLQHSGAHPRLGHQQCRRLSHDKTRTKPPPAKKKDNQFDNLVPALQAFYQIYGHFAVPHHFQVPTAISATGDNDGIQDDGSGVAASGQFQNDTRGDLDFPTLLQWSKELQGLKLDALVMRFCREVKKLKAPRKPGRQALTQTSSTKTTPPASDDGLESRAEVKTVRKQLNGIGFPVKRIVDVERGWSKFRWQEGVVEPLKAFKDLYGHLLVPQDFVVPSNNEKWPRCAWGSKLGSKVHHLRVYNLDHHQKSQLNAIGFIWDGHTAQREMWSRLFMPALCRYKELHGHCDVPEGFVVPTHKEQSGEDAWPDPLGGFVLGAVVHAIKLGRYGRSVVENFDELKQLGFLGEKLDIESYQYLYPMLSWYQKKYGHSRVDRDFVIPETSEDEWSQPLRRRDFGEMIWQSGFFASK